MSKFLYRRYVAIGDSLTEGLGDEGFEEDRMGKGWADRLAGLLSLEALDHGEEFYFANLALRGSGALEILTGQLEDAIRLRPDLVTIMAGANDLMGGTSMKTQIEVALRGAITRLHNIGCHVVLLDIARPDHLALFRPLAHKADEMSQLIKRMAIEFDTPLVNVNSMSQFRSLDFWCSDMAHFSHHGHRDIANATAGILGLNSSLPLQPTEGKRRRNAIEFIAWLVVDVIPFFKRRVFGQTSGDGLDPKQFEYETLVPALEINQSRVSRRVA